MFGNILRHKYRFINRLHGIQRSLLDEANPYLENLQHELYFEYEKVLFEEETLWVQKSRCNWISIGD